MKTIEQQVIKNTIAFANEQTDDNVLQLATLKLLTMAARGEIDLNLLARRELSQRGLDSDGKWVGFDKAKVLNGV